MAGIDRENGSLTPAQMRAIEMLAQGSSVEHAAVAARRSPRTLRRWRLEDPAYAAALRQAGDEAFADAGVQLRGLMQLALYRLGGVLSDEGVPLPHLLRACDLALTNALKLAEVTELRQRLEALEEALSR